jgi:hypothetical protein
MNEIRAASVKDTTFRVVPFNDYVLVVASAVKQSRNGRAVCKTRRGGLQRLDYASRIRKTSRIPEIASLACGRWLA